MKKIFFVSILLCGVFLMSCKKDDDKAKAKDFKFEATVISKGLDCGETFLISLKNLETNSAIEDGTYYADNLEAEYKVEGLKIYLNCRNPNNDELLPCTTLGPSYPHVVVLDSEKVKN
jgi:hypothetical protein